MQRKPWVKYDVTYAKFKTLQLYNFSKFDRNTTKEADVF